MVEAATPKKGGRPSKDPGGGKRPTITFRCRANLQGRIQAEAEKADRSVSEEVERQLEAAYDRIDNQESIVSGIAKLANDFMFNAIYEDLGGKENYHAGINLAHALRTYTREADAKFRSEAPWFQDADKKRYVLDKVTGILPFIIEQLVERLDPEAEQRRREALSGSPLAQLGAELYSASPDQGRVSSEAPGGAASSGPKK